MVSRSSKPTDQRLYCWMYCSLSVKTINYNTQDEKIMELEINDYETKRARTIYPRSKGFPLTVQNSLKGYLDRHTWRKPECTTVETFVIEITMMRKLRHCHRPRHSNRNEPVKFLFLIVWTFFFFFTIFFILVDILFRS